MAKLRFFYSVMNAGKSIHLLQVNHNYVSHKYNTLLLMPKVDDRFGEQKIASRLGVEASAVAIDDIGNIPEFIKNFQKTHGRLDCVLTDESQFFTYDNIYQLSDVVDELDIPVMCYGLKEDAYGHLFEGSKALIELADEVEEIKQICFCGRKANMIRKFSPEGNVVLAGEVIDIGAEEKFVSMCRKHWKTITNTKMIEQYLTTRRETDV